MEFDWSNTPFEWDSSLTPRDVEESFEDPFAVKLLPDTSRFSVQARFINLGRSAASGKKRTMLMDIPKLAIIAISPTAESTAEARPTSSG